MITMEKAIRIVLENTRLIDSGYVDLMDALARTLAEDVRSDIDMPPFDKSMMDGYAVVGSDLVQVSKEAPQVLQVVEEIAAGDLPRMLVSFGKSARIMTGAPMPKGADTVVMVEDTIAGLDGKSVKVLESVKTGDNIARLGEDVRNGQIVLKAPTLIRPLEIGILAAVGVIRIPVYRQPMVGVVATGSEIIEPHYIPSAGQIRNSNAYSMAAQVLQAGARTRYLGIVEDDVTSLCRIIEEGLDTCDILMLSGGVSAGAYDFVQNAMQKVGVEVFFDRIRMKPGKPLTFGVKGNKLIFGLPGNPVSSMVGFELLVRPAIRKMQKMIGIHRPVVQGYLVESFRQTPGRKNFVPAKCELIDGRWQAHWVGHHGSADLFSLWQANGLFVVEPGTDFLKVGAEVELILLTEW